MARRNGTSSIFRTEWKIFSPHRPPRTENHDVSFGSREVVHERLSSKLSFVKTQLERNVLRHGEEAVFSRAYFIGKR